MHRKFSGLALAAAATAQITAAPKREQIKEEQRAFRFTAAWAVRGLLSEVSGGISFAEVLFHRSVFGFKRREFSFLINELSE